MSDTVVTTINKLTARDIKDCTPACFLPNSPNKSACGGEQLDPETRPMVSM